MARVTLRLPESLHARLIAASRSADKSLNELIVETLDERVRPTSLAADDEGERFRAALADLRVSADDLLPRWSEERETPLLTHEELQKRLPRLDPPLSQTVIEDREDRV